MLKILKSFYFKIFQSFLNLYPLEIILICRFGAQEKCIIKHLLFIFINIFVETVMHLFQDSLNRKKSI